jgi:hypothetical protein
MNTEQALKRVKWSKISSMSEHDIKKPKTWERLSGSNSGIYFYLAHKPINYPFAKSKIFYIGKSNNLARRLAGHFNRDMRSKLLKDRETLEWFYLNYYLKKIPFDIVWIYHGKEEIEDMERLFVGLFSARFGAPPLCNASIQRRKLKETYEKCHNKRIIEKIEKIICEVEKG